ncbi:tRNA (guanine(37)-N1)-methyltransferase 2 [Artemisia annua]|uniref:tRNA (Guanine(37)-N1)-methyltransferase 2 n=1 Tax=Artemisia annua TaxID=35608 RepID=A0A2U1LZT9_ARTAN|nr:tRNA (guanine(37)-N1)-methyltransferase 2 [Artemisia annua]
MVTNWDSNCDCQGFKLQLMFSLSATVYGWPKEDRATHKYPWKLNSHLFTRGLFSTQIGNLLKIRAGVYNLSRMRGLASTRYKLYQIMIGWMQETGFATSIIKEEFGASCNFDVDNASHKLENMGILAKVKEYGASFKLGYGLVYWNSRLEHEHELGILLFEPPKKDALVYAKDLNSDSVRYMKFNADINKVNNNIRALDRWCGINCLVYS